MVADGLSVDADGERSASSIELLGNPATNFTIA